MSFTCILLQGDGMRMLRAVLKHVSFWNTFQISIVCRSEKYVPFRNILQISTVQTSSYRSRILNASSWNLKTCAKRPKVRQSLILHLFVYLFSVMSVGLFQMKWVEKTYCYLPSIWQSLHRANLKHISEWHNFQNARRCQHETCFWMAHVSERHTNTYICN